MYTYIKLKNYRSFGDICLDLKETKEKTKILALIYGENGSGKSNIVSAFYFIDHLLNSFDIEKRERQINNILANKSINDLSAYLDFLNIDTVDNLYKEARMVDCVDNTAIELGFEVDGHEGYYYVEFNNQIVKEKLYYYTGKQSGILYEINKDEKIKFTMSNSVFINSKYKNELIDLINKYWGRHSFLAIMYNETLNINKDFLDDNVSIYLFDFIKLLLKTSITLKTRINDNIVSSAEKINFISKLDNGDVSKDNEWLLDNTERIINDFFTQTYSDIKKCYFKRDLNEDRIKYHLFFSKLINGKIRNIPVEQESTGTNQILKVLRNLFGAFCGCTVIIDEIDNGVHDLLIKVVIESMIDYITGQVIITTHNTNLLDLIKPKYCYVINGDYKGNKEIVCLSDYKIDVNNSARSKYLKGLFGGVPLVDNVNYIEIINCLKHGRE